MREVARFFTSSFRIALLTSLVCVAVGQSSAAENAAQAVVFDPKPSGILFPIEASAREARQMTFGGSRQGPWAVFSSWRQTRVRAFFVLWPAGQHSPATDAFRAKGKLPVGCDAIGSVKSELGTLAGRCMASL